MRTATVARCRGVGCGARNNAPSMAMSTTKQSTSSFSKNSPSSSSTSSTSFSSSRRRLGAAAVSAPSATPSSSLRSLRCYASASPSTQQQQQLKPPGVGKTSPTVVYKFGGSSVADATRMREVADIVCSFPEHLPVIVLSAMGKTTNLLLAAGQEALTQKNPASVPSLAPLRAVKELHRATAQELGVDAKTVDAVEALLAELTQLLVGVSITQELTPRARDSLVSFGERLSTRLFAAYLRASGVPARNVDAWDAGLTTCDDFGSATVDYDASLPALRDALSPAPKDAPVAVFTGFLGRGAKTNAITTLGRGGSDLTCTLLGAALGLPEVQVWKDVDGVLTADPRIVGSEKARAVGALTYDEATELAFFGAAVLHPLAMQPAIQASLAAANAARSSSSSGSDSDSSSSSSSSASSRRGGNGAAASPSPSSSSASSLSSSSAFVPTPLSVRVKNSYNRTAPGTIIAAGRDDMRESLVTSVVLKDGVTLVDMVSTAAPGQVGFLANVFAAFRDCGVSVDVVATSEISVSLTLDPSRVWERELVDSELEALLAAVSKFAAATATRDVGCVSLICNVARTAEILERAFGVLKREGIPVLMMSQGASKTNISLVVGGGKEKGAGPRAIKALHAEFFE